MGILGNENTWWNDVLENGRASSYAVFRHRLVRPARPENRGRVLLPLLGDLYGDVLERGELRLACEGGSFHVQYHEHRFPLDPRSYRDILDTGPRSRSQPNSAQNTKPSLEFQSILTAIRNLPEHSETSPHRIAERHRRKGGDQAPARDADDGESAIEEAIAASLADLNGIPGEPRSFDALDLVLASQPYRLAYWRVARDEINYRRFFDVNALAAPAHGP